MCIRDSTKVVFACGGGIYSSAAEAAQKVGAKVIGVDVDQAGIIDSKYGDKMTVTSAMKGLAPTVKTMLTEIMAGNWDKYAGKVETLGLVSGDDPTQNYVQLPMDTTQWTDSFTQDNYKSCLLYTSPAATPLTSCCLLTNSPTSPRTFTALSTKRSCAATWPVTLL